MLLLRASPDAYLSVGCWRGQRTSPNLDSTLSVSTCRDLDSLLRGEGQGAVSHVLYVPQSVSTTGIQYVPVLYNARSSTAPELV